MKNKKAHTMSELRWLSNSEGLLHKAKSRIGTYTIDEFASPIRVSLGGIHIFEAASFAQAKDAVKEHYEKELAEHFGVRGKAMDISPEDFWNMVDGALEFEAENAEYNPGCTEGARSIISDASSERLAAAFAVLSGGVEALFNGNVSTYGPVDWIPFSERTPEKGHEIIGLGYGFPLPVIGKFVAAYKGEVVAGMIETDEEAMYVTHWLPLPEPPKTEGDKP